MKVGRTSSYKKMICRVIPQYRPKIIGNRLVIQGPGGYRLPVAEASDQRALKPLLKQLKSELRVRGNSTSYWLRSATARSDSNRTWSVVRTAKESAQNEEFCNLVIAWPTGLGLFTHFLPVAGQ